jgi:inosine-uridine nucleoside N-ribohydrolase
MTKRPILIDTDVAADDALSVLWALYRPDVEVVAVTVNCGNIPFEQQVENALYTVEFSGVHNPPPVIAGCREPLLRQYRSVPEVFGADGMGDSNLPKSTLMPAPRHAVDAIIELAREHSGELEIVALAPMTNLAVALARAPDIAQHIKTIYYMAGCLWARGNITMGAEYNAWVDPEAVRIVLRSGANLVFVPWEVAEDDAYVTGRERERMAALGTRTSQLYITITRVLHEYCDRVPGARGMTHADIVIMAVALEPQIVLKRERAFVDIECGGELSRGVTFLDWAGMDGREPNVDVIHRVDRDRFAALVHDFVATR